MRELRKEYASREEFEADRRRLWESGGWLVRSRVAGAGPGRRATVFPEVGGDFPWQLAAPILLVVVIVALVRWRRTRARGDRNERFSVVYGRTEP